MTTKLAISSGQSVEVPPVERLFAWTAPIAVENPSSVMTGLHIAAESHLMGEPPIPAVDTWLENRHGDLHPALRETVMQCLVGCVTIASREGLGLDALNMICDALQTAAEYLHEPTDVRVAVWRGVFVLRWGRLQIKDAEDHRPVPAILASKDSDEPAANMEAEPAWREMKAALERLEAFRRTQ